MKKLKINLFSDESYGPNCEKPDVTDTEFAIEKHAFLIALKKTPEEITKLEISTRMQAENPNWKEQRRKLLTASNFGAVCNKLPYTSCQNIVKRILYSNTDTASMQYGRIHEIDAKKDIESLENIKISECGLFVDEKLNFLGASPDGFIQEYDAIVEIKCPSSCENLYPNEAILQRKCTFWKIDKKKLTVLEINKKHAYYFQIQGQLHITKKKHCLFALWTPKGIKIERIEKDEEFWAKEMEKKLKDFYFDCLLPEILDPRFPRTMPIRDPKYILEAIENNKMKKRKL